MSSTSTIEERFRQYLLEWVLSGTATVVALQAWCGVESVETSQHLDSDSASGATETPASLRSSTSSPPPNGDSSNNSDLIYPHPSSHPSSAISPAPSPSPPLNPSNDSDSLPSPTLKKRNPQQINTKKSSPETESAEVHRHDASSAKPSSAVPYRIRNHFFHFWFRNAAMAGNEEFYIISLPFLFWGVSAIIARRIISMWMAVYYVGQAIKDILKLPRPPAPPVIQIETHYSAEYGLPSTHAMSALALPFYMLMLCVSFDVVTFSQLTNIILSNQKFFFAFLFVLFWCFSVSFSRLYMGVHSPADVTSGLFLSAVLLAVFSQWGPAVDGFVMNNKWSPIVVFIIAVILLLIYPAPEKWTNAYGDTTIIVSVWLGVNLGQHYISPEYRAQQFIFDYSSVVLFLYSFIVSIVICILRTIFGVVVALLTRLIVKKIGLMTAKFIVKMLGKKDVDLAHTYAVEIPIKFFTYAGIGWNSAFTVPMVFLFIGSK